MEGKQDGDGDGKGPDRKVLKEIERYKERYHSVKKWLLCSPLFPSLPPFSQFLFPRWPITAN